MDTPTGVEPVCWEDHGPNEFCEFCPAGPIDAAKLRATFAPKPTHCPCADPGNCDEC